VEIADFQVVSSASMHTIKRLTVNFYTPTICEFCPDGFLKFIFVMRHMTFKLRLLWGVDWQSRIGLIFLIHISLSERH